MEAMEEADEAYSQLDEEAFEDTGCVRLSRQGGYRLLRCHEEMPPFLLEKYPYEIELTNNVPEAHCYLVIFQEDGKPLVMLTSVVTLLFYEAE